MNLNSCHIIGIDCATEPKKRGVALARCEDNKWVIESAGVGLEDEDVRTMLDKCKQVGGRVLLALDAPLGWPKTLGCHLVDHRAGKRLSQLDSHALFRRETDRFIKKTYGIQSLDVGADRIARTAHSALNLLHTIGEGSIPLATDENFQGISAIEVYPAATLFVHGLKSQTYKNSESEEVRKKILQGLEGRGVSISKEDVRSKAIKNADVLDAIVCVLAGIDFLKGKAHSPKPEQADLAANEGWIWVRKNFQETPEGSAIDTRHLN